MECQLRNWFHFTWLCGDHIVEQHVHNLDVVNWVMGGKPPVRVFGVGGRQARTAPEYGHIYDHFALDYEYQNGHVLSMCRQQPGTPGLVAEFAAGTKGTCDTQDGVRYEIKGPNAWKWTGEYTNPYVQEHTDLIASIRAGNPLNELRRVAESTLTAIVGRKSAYTGKVVALDAAAQLAVQPDAVEAGVRADCRAGSRYSRRRRHELSMRKLGLLFLLALSCAGLTARAQAPNKKVLYLTYSAGYRHDVIPLSMQLLPEIGKKNGFDVVATKDLAFLYPKS